ncbi:MAG: peptidase [Magnetococcales bacterium]|nr:peptidase [Magnetococcales bacterium]
MSAIKPIRIFRAGTHTDMSGATRTFSESDLKAMADSYEPSAHEAPLVLGHPDTNAPAYGWVERLSVTGGDLYAHLKQVDPGFAEMVNQGRFKHVSASLYLPESSSNPKRGALYLRHVGFLGAMAPAVKGLGEVKFREGESDVIAVAFVEFHEAGNQEKKTMATEEEMAKLAKREAELAAKEAQFAERERKLQHAEEERRAKEHNDFVETLVREGRVVPMQTPRLVALLTALDGRESLSFSEGSGPVQAPPGQILKDFLCKLPVQVDFAERARDDDSQTASPVPFQHPPGFRVDPARLTQHQQAMNYAAVHNTDYLTAVTMLGRPNQR